MDPEKYENDKCKRAKTDGTGPEQSAELPGVAKAATSVEPGELVVSTDAGSGEPGGGLAASATGQAGADLVSGVRTSKGKPG
jgi:hypothetical protein